MSGPGPVSKVVIVGGGLDGWSAAAALAQAFPGQGLEISVVSGHVPDTPVTAQTAPVSQVFHQRLGIDEPAMMRACDATFSLGTRFRDWVRDGHDYFQPIGPHGASIEFVHFHNFANKARQAGDETPFNDYSLCAVAARKGKFSHPSPDRNSILSTLFYAHHVKLDAYAGLMRELALNAGVSEIGARVESVVSGDGEARIEALRLEGGDQLTADLFLDCSGPGAVLINALDTDFEDWGGLLPADRLVTAMGPGTEVEPMTTVTGLEHGWHQRMPLQGGTGHCLVCRADDQGDEEALAAFREAAGDEPASNARLSILRAGRQARAWVGNCVALGSASVALPPLEFAQLALLQTAVMRLITLFPDRDCSPHIASEFNEVSAAEHRNVRDFLVLHYLGVERQSPFWTEHREAELPESLAYKIRLFREHGQVAFYEEESYPDTSWVSVWLGQDQWPKDYDPVLDKYDFERLETRFANMRDIIVQAADAMPPHAEYLRQYCAAR